MAAFAVGGWGDDGLPLWQPVGDHVEEAAKAGTGGGEDQHPEVGHYCIIPYSPPHLYLSPSRGRGHE